MFVTYTGLGFPRMHFVYTNVDLLITFSFHWKYFWIINLVKSQAWVHICIFTINACLVLEHKDAREFSYKSSNRTHLKSTWHKFAWFAWSIQLLSSVKASLFELTYIRIVNVCFYIFTLYMWYLTRSIIYMCVKRSFVKINNYIIMVLYGIVNFYSCRDMHNIPPAAYH